MSKKFLIAAASAILLASTALASAQPRPHRHVQLQRDYGYSYSYVPYAGSYYDRSYWDAVAPNFYVRPDPFVGTIWEGVVPY
jgi:opacity protein-like surface antigen